MSAESRNEDARLVALAQAGDREAFGQLVENHSRSLFALAFRVTGNEADADEVVQETFLRAFRSLKNFESRSNLGTWLYRIAMNCALDQKDREKWDPKYAVAISEDPDPKENQVQLQARQPDQEQQIFSGQIQKKIGEAMSQLTKTERAAFTMRHLEGRSIDEICSTLGLKTNAAKNSIFRAVQKMRTALGPMMAVAR